MARYEYQPLKKNTTKIRLLTLLPGQFNDPIRITIEKKDLNKKQAFEALSYTWGSASDPLEVIVETRSSGYDLSRVKRWTRVEFTSLPVTRNLFEALQHLRYTDRSRVLWIDAICINQQDLEERGHQVLRMPDIYSLAGGVIAWLGPEYENSTTAMRVLDHIGSKFAVDRSTNRFVTISVGDDDVTPDETENTIHQQMEILLAIKNLLSRPYFKRLWVVQEVALGKETLQVTCGFASSSYRRFFNAISYLKSSAESSVWVGVLDGRAGLHDIRRSEFATMATRLYLGSQYQCSDERDRVFAVLSLVAEKQRLGIQPDYTRTVREVFQDIVLRHIAYHRDLDILRYCSSAGEIRHLPTWVPNWSVNTQQSRWSTSADANARAHIRFVSNEVLAVTGLYITTVCGVKTDLPQHIPIDKNGSTRVLRKMISATIDCNDGLNRFEHMKYLCRVLCANRFSNCYVPSDRGCPDRQEAENYFEKCSRCRGDFNDIPEPGILYIRSINEMLEKRFLMETIDRRLGLAPEAAAPGDQVCILLGCSSPMILRPVSDKKYAVVGACYLDGIMSGEALLGELPSNWSIVLEWIAGYQDHRSRFYDSETGKTQREDPRLRPPSGDVQWNYKDELTPDALRRRGIDATVFELI
ncbi:MAG: hypothetical protein L6R41_005596 [Letrouitia leprolyta]|nr:MAG: hypothetical protein L6R41_005596 [Letrouitia leprolyta]